MSISYPIIRLVKGGGKRARHGHPWIFSNEVAMTASAKALAPGSLVIVEDAGGEALGLYGFNPHTLIAARLLTRNIAAVIDAGFIAERLGGAVQLRNRLFDRPYYRLIHAEADGLPGLVIDRFGDAVVAQANTAMMDRLSPQLTEALEQTLSPARIIFKNDSPARKLEGLELATFAAKGGEESLAVEENGLRFVCDPLGGQKTGWFYDHRDNRAFVAKLTKERRVIDYYTYAGGFAITCAASGASSVVAVDRSEGSLALAAEAARLNGLADRVSVQRAEVFADAERRVASGKRFGLVIADPPAFVKSKKDLQPGLKGYRKLARLTAALVEPGGFLFLASCSHNVGVADFAETCKRGLDDAGRTGRILRTSGAGADHPVHPALPETAYLKGILYQLD
ncbi:MAG: class I SAM-dependent rRNA methyltransferase [Sphingomonadales bacterium]|nr:class I SAM-dependent rRNA methyltransferase [Sphingomonadales bacterium]